MAIPVSMLPQRCTIQRQAATSTTPTGKTVGAFSTLASDVPCRMWGVGGTEQFTDATREVESRRMVFLPSQDVTERDRVVLDGHTMEVVSVESCADGRGIAHQLRVRVTDIGR